LKNVHQAHQLAKDKVDGNQVDANYKKLKCDIQPVPKSSADYKMVETFINNTGDRWNAEILSMFYLEREGEKERYIGDKVGNKFLLWHGSRLTNYVGILSQGLRIAPPEAPCTGYRVGKGIYLADMFDKSAGYCFSYGSNGVFCIMLIEGAMGKPRELDHDDNYAHNNLGGKDSTLARGRNAPPASSYQKFEKDITVPLGKPTQTKHTNTSFSHNEYVLYDVKQARLRFLIWMKDKNYRKW